MHIHITMFPSMTYTSHKIKNEMKPMSGQYTTEPKLKFSEHKLQRIERIISSNAGLEDCILMGGLHSVDNGMSDWDNFCKRDKNRFT